MAELTPTQEIIIQAALAREDGSIHPLPSHIKGGAARKTIASLQAKGIVSPEDKITMHALMYLDPDWLSVRGQYLNRIEAEKEAKYFADKAQAALALPTDNKATTALEINETSTALALETNSDFEEDVATTEQALVATKTCRTKDGTKKAKVIEMMRRPEGATAAQIAEATGWQPHTIRGFLSIAKKKLGLEITTNRLRIVGPNQQGSPGSFTTYFL